MSLSVVRARRDAFRLCTQSRMDIVHTGLETDRADTGHSEDFCTLLESQITCVDDPAIRLLNAVSVDRIIEEKGEVREEIESIVLRMALAKNCPPDGVS